MDGVGRLRRRKSLQERLGLGCCGGPTWGSRPATTMSVGDDDDDYEDVGEGSFLHEAQQQIEVVGVDRTPPENIQELECISHPPATPGMNLAAALAAERHYREVEDTVIVIGPGPSPSPVRPNGPNEVEPPTTPLRVSLLRLLEESDGVDENEEKSGGLGNDQMCCVCMGRKKGAAFIPCGHTFCRVCSRELWLNRGSCPLCNRSILEILDIF